MNHFIKLLCIYIKAVWIKNGNIKEKEQRRDKRKKAKEEDKNLIF
jgi:hypothetical protein